MQFQVRRATEIDDRLALEWTRLLRVRGYEGLPFLLPEYIAAMAPYRSSLCVATACENGRLRVVLPFEQHGLTGHPPGIRLSDYQSVICDDGVSVNVREMLKDCGLKRLTFDHLITETAAFSKWHEPTDDTYWIDLRGGIQQWESEIAITSGQTHRSARRKERTLDREVGRLEFEWQVDDDDVFNQVLAWKSSQRVRTQSFDVLQYDWIRGFLDELRLLREPSLQTCLSTLRANGRLIAGSFGLLTESSYYDWFPAYDFEYRRYSPGLQLTLWKIREAARRGITRFDFGKGPHQQKLSLASRVTPLAAAVIDVRPIPHAIHRVVAQTRRFLNSSGLQRYATVPKRFFRSQLLRRAMK